MATIHTRSGPALSGSQGQAAVKASFPWTFFLIAFGFSWLVWLPGVLATYGVIASPLPQEALAPLLLLIGAFGPLVSSVLLTAREAGRAGVRRFLKRGLNFRIPLPWLAVTLGLPVVFSAAARYLDLLTGGTPPPYGFGSPLALLPAFLFILLLGGPIQEEYGWRGYALDRMQARWGSFTASLILGALWTLWHLPFWFIAGSGMEGTPLPVYGLYTTGLSAVMAWAYFGSGRNVLVAILFHTMANFSANLFPTHGPEPGSSRAYLFLAVFYVAAALILKLRGGFQDRSGEEAGSWPAGA